MACEWAAPHETNRDTITMSLSSLGIAAAAFLASGVEFVEALTIVLAVGLTRGWRSSLWGAGVALATLALAVVTAGPGVTGHLPRHWLQLAVGVLLLIFGLQWLRKAIFRSAGLIALHDEDEAFASESTAARRAPEESRFGLDWYAFTVSFKGVLLEGLEVAFIVVSFGATSADLQPAVLGAGTAFVLVLIVGALVHRPLSRVPENLVKYSVGLLLSTFGTFWLVEGLNAVAAHGRPISWPGGDAALPVILAAWFACSQACVLWLRRDLPQEAM
jgi:Ca2+/H+ antiporter, TMEM165/GDT1 family